MPIAAVAECNGDLAADKRLLSPGTPLDRKGTRGVRADSQRKPQE